MLNIKFQLLNKSLISIVLFISFCAFTNRKPRINLNEDYTISNDTIPEIMIRSTMKKGNRIYPNAYNMIIEDTISEITGHTTKRKRYRTYLNFCNEIVTDTILQSGYINFDTLRVSYVPANKLYFGKAIIKSVQLSKEKANIILADTIWNLIEIPEYRSTRDYYVLSKHPMPEAKIVDIDYTNKIIVFRPRECMWKRSKPLLFSDWDKYINNKSNRNSAKEQYF